MTCIELAVYLGEILGASVGRGGFKLAYISRKLIQHFSPFPIVELDLAVVNFLTSLCSSCSI